MCQFVDLRDKFLTKEIYTIYAPCMYQPTWEKFCKKAKHYVENKNIFIMGAITENTIAGVIVLEKQSDGHLFEILGIAVNAALRQQGIGRKMVQYARENLGASEIYAETDDGAVEFYRHCNFEINTHTETFPDGECVRYQCVLK